MSIYIQLAVLLLCLIQVVTTQQPSYLSGRLKDEFLPDLSPCCKRLNDRCQRAKKECYDYIKTPFLLLTCRCRISIQQEYQDYREQCMRDAVDFFLEKLEEEERRMNLGYLPGHTNTFPGKPADSGASGPKDRGLVNLSEDYLRKKNQEYLEKIAKETDMSDIEDVTDDDFINDDVNGVDGDRIDRDAIADEIISNTGPEINLDSDESLLDSMAYMKA